MVVPPSLRLPVVLSSWTMWPELETVCVHKALLCSSLETPSCAVNGGEASVLFLFWRWESVSDIELCFDV